MIRTVIFDIGNVLDRIRPRGIQRCRDCRIDGAGSTGYEKSYDSVMNYLEEHWK